MNNKCKCDFLEEIHGFNSLFEYEKFQEYLNHQINNKFLKEIRVNQNYEKGLVYGGKWYKCFGCHEIWRLVEPDFPFRGLWEKVDI